MKTLEPKRTITMKQLIRKGVFETNSSSSHSIAIATEDKEFVLDTIYPDQNGIITIHGDEYGWEWFKHNDSQTKASYAAQSFANDDFQLDILKEVIIEQTGATDVVFEGLNDGYIDHDSYGIVPTSKEELRNLIFNKNSWLFGGNDNSSPDPTFYHVPEIKDGKIIQPVYKYELSVEGIKKTTKYLTKPTDDELNDGIDSILEDSIMTEDGSFITDNSIFWQISRNKEKYYEKGYRIDQDYSTGEVRLSRERDDRFHEVENDLKESGLLEGISWDERRKLITDRYMSVPGLVKTVKFTLKEL
jgi:hypothetical protein